MQDDAAAGKTTATARAECDDVVDSSASPIPQASVAFDNKPTAEPQLPPTATADHTSECNGRLQTASDAATPRVKVRY